VFNPNKYRDMLAEAVYALNVRADQLKAGMYTYEQGTVEFEQNGERFLMKIEHLPERRHKFQ